MAVICFDYDGTIGDSLSIEEKYYLPACRRAGVALFPTMAELKAACHENFYHFCAKNGVTAAQNKTINNDYHEALNRDGVVIPFFDGAVDLVNDVGKKYPVYILSLNSSAFIRKRSAEAGLTAFIEVIGREESADKITVFQRLGQRWPGEEIWFITDSVGDVKEAKAAGVNRVIAVTYGWGEKKDLAAAGGEVLIASVTELRTYLEKALHLTAGRDVL